MEIERITEPTASSESRLTPGELVSGAG